MTVRQADESPPQGRTRGAERSAARLSWVKGVAVLSLFALGAFALAAGGLGMAPVAALGGVCALAVATLDPCLRRALKPGPAAWVGAALIAWAAISLMWTPYDRPANLARTAAGAATYVAFFLLCLSTDGPGRRLARAGVLLCALAAGAFFAFELATGGVITASHRADALDPNQVWRNLGHGLSSWLVVLPGALLVLPRGDAVSTGTGVALLLIAAACSLGFGLTSNAAGLIAGAAAAAAAWRSPRAAIAAIGGMTAVAILLAPVCGLIARVVPESVRAVIPDSWELRLEAWTYAVDRIGERPIHGWGFDASRTMTETIMFRGEAVEAMPLHPHNAGLHLWLETGLVGAALAAALTVLLARAVARAPGLTRDQAMAAAAAAAAYVVMAQVSYGVWQEWWVATIAWAASAAALTGPAARESAAP